MRPERSGGIDSAYSNTPLLCTDWHLRCVCVCGGEAGRGEGGRRGIAMVLLIAINPIR